MEKKNRHAGERAREEKKRVECMRLYRTTRITVVLSTVGEGLLLNAVLEDSARWKTKRPALASQPLLCTLLVF